jgi:hypothetical protein
MQEVSVKPRSVFKHAIIVREHQAQELQYSFNTRKNNIKFGIYKREAEGEAMAQRTATTSVTARLLPRDSVLSATSPAALTFGEASASKPFDELMVDCGLVPVLPVAHYQSSKYTINGSHHITEPGVYYLVFDNTFSV